MNIVETSEGVVREWIDCGEPFVFYRLPGEMSCRGIRAAFPLRRMEDISSLDHQEGFVFAPFQPGEGHPLWLFPAGEEVRFSFTRKREDVVEAPAPVPLCGSLSPVPSLEYSGVFARFLAALHSGTCQKLVLSRRWETECPSPLSLAGAFQVACQRYVHSYVYLLYIPQTGYWLGATPELLLSGRGNDYKTVALAGTQVLAGGRLSGEWSEKNIREQRYVSDYICDCLGKRGIEAHADPPFTATAGTLAHLKTEVRFSWDATGGIGGLLSDLHPTPAVCGVPKSEAYRFICAHEGYDRSYYAGFLGRIGTDRTDLYVNIRCMQTDADKKHMRLFAGGGLLSSSLCEDEWMETERKLQTMKYVIQKESHVFG